ncbi:MULTISPECIES: hypothetical protein [Halocynthiibacter]|uniref:Uncharacterized protein n=1 Tax=Halocynthiibacter halioticoli TaxID=2986804 RepID=A0AAE3IYT6_9RHOB|nr:MULTISPECIES: hypothetical protein [Halocynthiibacter]MCV6824590.1 hypothetical protein [Halocynthiibacter halioticoli]MCW4057591.1 hypothetical protein [Halocynthiibacter sp. SDUM655004]
MPRNKFILLLSAVFAAAAGTVFIGSFLAESISAPWVGMLIGPLMLLAYVAVRVVRARLEADQTDT